MSNLTFENAMSGNTPENSTLSGHKLKTDTMLGHKPANNTMSNNKLANYTLLDHKPPKCHISHLKMQHQVTLLKITYCQVTNLKLTQG